MTCKTGDCVSSLFRWHRHRLLLALLLAGFAFTTLFFTRQAIYREWVGELAVISKIEMGIDIYREPVYSRVWTVILPEDAINRVIGIQNRGEQVDDDNMSRFAEFRFLRFLKIPFARVSSRGVETFAKHRYLEELNLNCTLIDDAVAPTLKSLRLKELRVAKTLVSDETVIDISVDLLEELDVSFTRITGTGLRTLLSGTKLTTLNTAGLGAENEDFQDLHRHARLSSLDVSATRIDQAALSHIGKCRDLYTFNASETKLTNDVFANVPQHVAFLYLRGCDLTDAAHLHFRKDSAWLFVDVSQTGVGDKTVRALLRIPSLTSLKIDHTSVTSNGLAACLMRRPGDLRVFARDVNASFYEASDIVDESFESAYGQTILYTNDHPAPSGYGEQSDRTRWESTVRVSEQALSISFLGTNRPSF